MSAFRSRRILGLPLWRWEGLSYVVTTFGALSVIIATCGVLFAGLQYFWNLEADRAKETLDLIEIWETRGYQKDFSDLRTSVSDFLDKVPAEEIAFAKSSERASNNLQRNMQKAVLGTKANSEKFERVIYFFNRLGLCVAARLCSKNTARVFFEDPIKAFLSNFTPYIQEQRKTYPNYADGILLLKKTMGD